VPNHNKGKWLTLGVVLVGAGLAPAVHAQLQSLERNGPGASTPPPAPRIVAPATKTVEPDPSGVWYHVRRNDLNSARSDLQRLKIENPGWRVPSDLEAAVNGQRAQTTSAPQDMVSAHVNAAERGIRAGRIGMLDLDALILPLQRRQDSGAAERLGRALYETGALPQARAWLDRARAWAKSGSAQESAAVIGLVKTNIALGDWQAAEADVATLPVGPALNQAAQLLMDSATAAAENAARGGDWAKADKLAALADSIGTSRVRTSLGWAALDAGDDVRAAVSFAAGPQNEESRFGRILALSRLTGDNTALTAACMPQDRSSRTTDACGDAFAVRALAAYNANDWDSVIALDATARTLNVGRGGTHLLTGWSHYRHENYGKALEAFDDADSGGQDAADGIVTTLMAMNQYKELSQRAAHAPRLDKAYRQQMGALAMSRKRFSVAQVMAVPGTEGMSEPSFSVGAFTRQKTGAKGADQLNWQGLSISARMARGSHKFSGGVELGEMRVGTPAPGAPIGSGVPATVTISRPTRLASPWLRWDVENIDSAYSVAVGTTPVGGVIDPLPVAAVGMTRDWNNFIGTVGVKITPRGDSLLAMSGLQDAATGATWGRVVEISPQVGLIALLTDKISLAANAAYGVLHGRNVARNSHATAGVSLTYEAKVPGFDYIRVGPAYTFDHYAKNQNFFTLGNGGYYSPGAGHSAGGFIDFQTAEGRRWQIAGRITGAWQYSVEKSAPRFPLADDGTRFAGLRQSQFGTDSVLRGSALLGSHLILGAYGRVTYAPSGRDIAGGLSITIPFGARSAMYSSDLPHFADRSWP
jgi:tetratricopeptide (TPR) repeat protein